MGDQREKCSGRPERKGRQLPYRPRDAPRPEPLANVPGPDHPRFADIRPFFRQRKDDAEKRRREQLELSRRKAEAISDARIRRQFEREEAERQRELEAFWRTFHRKVRMEDRVARHLPEHGRGDRNGGGAGSHSVRPPYALAAYSAPVMDRQGRRGVFMSSTYLSAKTSAYGSMRRLSYYVTNPESLEEIEDGRAFFSNMGETRHEIATGMGLVEDANRAARANAKVAVTFIVQLPHDVTPKERLRILRVWCEEKLGIHDLPYVAALHKPSPDGDQRNHHGHVVTSFRPAFRTGRYEWRIAQGLRTDLDNPAMFEEFRRDFATIMTAVVQIAGKDRIYTHLSHAARGLKHKPTEKLGPQKTRDVRAGEHVPANVRNAQVIGRNEALAEIDRIDERAARRRGWMQRLQQLKMGAARPLSAVIAVLASERPARTSVLAQIGRHVLPHLSPVLLAAAARATDAPRLRDGVPDRDHNLTQAPALQDVVLLADFKHAPSAVIAPKRSARISHRVSNVTDSVEIPITAPIRRPTQPDLPGGERARADSFGARPAIEAPVAASIHELAAQIDAVPDRRASHRLSSSSTVNRMGEGLRRLTSVAPVVRSGSSPKQLSIVHESGRADPVAGSQPPAQIATPTLRIPVARQLSNVALVENYGRALSRRLSDRRPVDRLAADPARSLNVTEATSSAAHGKVRTLDLLSVKLARLKARVVEVEQQDEARAQAEAARTTARQQAADYERYLRFLALVALNPDWLEHGKLGLDLAAHAPARARELYASWRNDHERLATIGEVRQAALDGVHRINPALAAQVERTAADLVARLPAPPPLRDSVGRPSPAAEFAMALVAANPHWLINSSRTVQASLDAPPALVGVVERHEKDPALGSLLAAAKRHSEGITTALQPTLAMMVDRRREEIALRRAGGLLRVLAPDGDRLSPVMADHLAKARRHPEWIVRGKHLGLGPAEGVPPTFREQWLGWNEPALARQLLLDIVAPTSATRALTPAMRTQVVELMQAFSHHDVTGKGRVRPDEGRSR